MDKELKSTFAVECPTYGIFYEESMTHNLIRWTFRQKANGGRCSINEPFVEVFPFGVIQFPASEFIRLAMLSSDGICFTDLGNELNSVFEMVKAFDGCPLESKITFLIINIDTEHLKIRRKVSSLTKYESQ